MGGRAELLLGPIGILIVAFAVFMGLIRWSRDRGRRSSGGDPLGLEPETAEPETGGKAGLQTVLPSFQAFLDEVVRPRRLAHPEWERLDGAVGVPGRTIASFERGGTVYNVNGETSFAALDALERWMLAHPGEDPFVILPGRRGAGRIGARPETGWTDQKALRIETG